MTRAKRVKPKGKHVREKLSAAEVEKKRKPGRYADGGGLYLQIAPTGAKSWLFRYMLKGKAREMGLGPLSVLSLAEARDAADLHRKVLKAGTDPLAARDAAEAAKSLEEGRSRTFWQCCESFLESPPDEWANAKHAKQWRSTLETYAKEKIGKMPVSAIDTGDVLAVLEPIWRTKTETASRLRGRIESVLDWAKVRGFRSGENPARWRGHLDKTLPKRTKVAMVQHHPALPFPEAGEFVKELRAQVGTAARALELIILTATRTSEALGARWDEIDTAAAVWSIPAERMKAKKPHRVPLSPATIALLERTKAESPTSSFVFPGRDPKKPLSNMACLKVLERMDRADLTVHGFRSTFRDWAGEQTNFPREIAEAALAHVIEGKTEGAYRRGDSLEKRRRLMEAWSRHCSTTGTATVHNINRHKNSKSTRAP